MGTEDLTNKIDLVVMTGSVPFITAGVFLEDQTDATLISGALSGMSSMFNEMLQQGELRHSELYNAHIYIRHLVHINDPQNLLSSQLKRTAQMRAALIVREGELTKEQELALSELCYSIMVKICERDDIANKLLKGNIEGYNPTNLEKRMILAEAIKDYRSRARKSQFYENPNFLPEKAKFSPLPKNDELLETRIDDFIDWISEDYYPDYLPRIDFHHFFGKEEYWKAINKLQDELSEKLQKEELKEAVRTDLFNYLLKAGLIPIVMFSDDINKRIEDFITKELPRVFDSFLTNLLLKRGPIGISLKSINNNLLELPFNHQNKIGWQFAKLFLKNTGDRPFELPYLKELCSILQIFDLQKPFLAEIYRFMNNKFVPDEFLEVFIDIVNACLKKPVDLAEICVNTPVISSSALQSKNSAPELPKHLGNTGLADNPKFKEYCETREELTNLLQQKRTIIMEQKEADTTSASSQAKNLSKETSANLLKELLQQVEKIEKEIRNESYGVVAKNKLEEIFERIRDGKLEQAQPKLANVIETFDVLELTDSDLVELLAESNDILKQLVVLDNSTGQQDAKGEQPITYTVKELEQKITHMTESIAKEAYEKLLEQISILESFLSKKDYNQLVKKIKQLDSLKTVLAKENEQKRKQPKKTKTKKQEKKSKLSLKKALPKPSAESKRMVKEILFKTIGKSYSWTHEYLFGHFSLDKKLMPNVEKDGLFFYYILDSITKETGLIFDIIQCYTGPRTKLIGKLDRLIDSVNNKLQTYIPETSIKYRAEKKLSLDVQHVNIEFKQKCEKIVEILMKIENDAVKGKITNDNIKDYLESGFLGRSQEISIPQAKKILSDLKSLNKNLSNKELNVISSATSINIKRLTNTISSKMSRITPIPQKDSHFSKINRDYLSFIGNIDIDLPDVFDAIFTTIPYFEDESSFLIHDRLINSILRCSLSDDLNQHFEELEKGSSLRRDFVTHSFAFKNELFTLIGENLLTREDLLKQFLSINIVAKENKNGQFTTKYAAISPPTFSNELEEYFLISKDEKTKGNAITGRAYDYTPFNNEKPTNLAELIVSNSFRKAYETVAGGLESIDKIGKKLHSGVPTLHETLMQTYRLIAKKLSYNSSDSS